MYGAIFLDMLAFLGCLILLGLTVIAICIITVVICMIIKGSIYAFREIAEKNRNNKYSDD